MQPNDDNLENNSRNIDFTLDDSSDSAISWDDIMGEDDNASSKEQGDGINSDENNSSFDDFDLNALGDDTILDSIEINPQEASSENPNEQNSENFENSENINNIPKTNENQNEQNSDYLNNAVYTSDDQDLMSNGGEDIDVENADLSGIVDDELLNILDNNNLDGNQQEKSSTEGDSVLTSESIQSWLDDNDSQNEQADYQNSSINENNGLGVISDDDINRANHEKQVSVIKPSKAPILAAALLLLIVLLVAVNGVKYINYKKVTTAATQQETQEDIVATPYDGDDNVRQSVNTDQVASIDPTGDLVNDNNDLKAKKPVKKEDQNAQEENLLSDKKVIIDVHSEGRSNPFMPSSMFNSKGYASYGASLPMPPDGVIDSPEAQEARKLLSISVSGIMYDSVKPSAILKFDGKDYFVQKGDRIDTYTVNDITKDHVAIKNASNIYKAYVGEAFQLDGGRIPASNQMRYNGKTRQYISSDDIQISTK